MSLCFRTFICFHVCYKTSWTHVSIPCRPANLIPNVIGSIDSTFIRINHHKNFGNIQSFWNYKQYHAVKLQVCTDLIVQWVGFVHLFLNINATKLSLGRLLHEKIFYFSMHLLVGLEEHMTLLHFVEANYVRNYIHALMATSTCYWVTRHTL